MITEEKIVSILQQYLRDYKYYFDSNDISPRKEYVKENYVKNMLDDENILCIKDEKQLLLEAKWVCFTTHGLYVKNGNARQQNFTVRYTNIESIKVVEKAKMYHLFVNDTVFDVYSSATNEYWCLMYAIAEISIGLGNERLLKDWDLMYRLGLNYDESRYGIAQDYDKAAFYYRKAAEQGHQTAKEKLKCPGIDEAYKRLMKSKRVS